MDNEWSPVSVTRNNNNEGSMLQADWEVSGEGNSARMRSTDIVSYTAAMVMSQWLTHLVHGGLHAHVLC